MLEEIATVLQEIAPPRRLRSITRPRPRPVAASTGGAGAPLATRHAARSIDAETTRHQVPLAQPESERERLERLLKFVARQEPGLRWAVGNREDGTTLLVTDLAHGWIPPGITLPADVRLLEPAPAHGHRGGVTRTDSGVGDLRPRRPVGLGDRL